ncbi:polysaccharide export protein [Mucilaginibacter achroorhodeus]|uniref:Polysaccharide export protein n=1 Tax=Mucilaginibacter achroorhodeus TaxID=2599294 RepID=A0A563U9Q2_9SPHI|nr:polysaccharide biosynthesis/export family protein [Mucilaginibacter achroorhodeus]TWR28013.1 polysaccharide export protein [Mucilaginibacter achroorhodeus]
MKKRLYLKVLFFAFIIASLSSCVSQKQIAYFQKDINGKDTIRVAEAYVPKIQSGDILSIYVSSLNPVASSFFNPYAPSPGLASETAGTGSSTPSVGQQSPASSSAPGFLVDPQGRIELPLVGEITAAGRTTSELRDTIKNRLKTYLKEPTVNVRFLNYKISVMGEVARPSVYVIPNEKVTLPEALSMAGDITIFGKRDNVLIVRDNNGKKEFGRINLNTREVYSSPYYYLHSNDIVYVEPGKGKIAQTDKTYQILPIILSALSFLSIIFVYSKR